MDKDTRPSAPRRPGTLLDRQQHAEVADCVSIIPMAEIGSVGLEAVESKRTRGLVSGC